MHCPPSLRRELQHFSIENSPTHRYSTALFALYIACYSPYNPTFTCRKTHCLIFRFCLLGFSENPLRQSSDPHLGSVRVRERESAGERERGGTVSPHPLNSPTLFSSSLIATSCKAKNVHQGLSRNHRDSDIRCLIMKCHFV